MTGYDVFAIVVILFSVAAGWVRGGVREVITDGVSGLLAPDDAGLADALVRIVADDTLRTRIAAHNRRVPPAQTWDRVVALAVDEYRRAGA